MVAAVWTVGDRLLTTLTETNLEAKFARWALLRQEAIHVSWEAYFQWGSPFQFERQSLEVTGFADQRGGRWRYEYCNRRK